MLVQQNPDGRWTASQTRRRASGKNATVVATGRSRHTAVLALRLTVLFDRCERGTWRNQLSIIVLLIFGASAIAAVAWPGQLPAAPNVVVTATEVSPPRAAVATTTTAAPTTTTEPYADVAPSLAAQLDTFNPSSWAEFQSVVPELTPLEEAQQLWEQGYLDSGADPEWLDAFWRPGGIVECETNYRNVHSDTGDSGWAQNNQIHREWFNSLTGQNLAYWPYREQMLDTYWNGFLAGHLVKRRDDRGSNPYGDWFRSGHCHGLA